MACRMAVCRHSHVFRTPLWSRAVLRKNLGKCSSGTWAAASKAAIVCLFFVLSVSSAYSQYLYDGNNNLPPFGSFSGSDFDVVSLQNGNLHIRIPILTVTQRGAKPVEYFYVYDTPDFVWTYTPPQHNQLSGQWIVGCCTTTGWILANSTFWNTGSQKSLSVMCSAYGTPFTEYTWNVVDPERTKHPLALLTTTAPCAVQHLHSSTLDATDTVVNLNSDGTVSSLILKDGTKPINGALEDTNGNLITNAGAPKNVENYPGADTLNRYPLVASGSAPNPQTWTYTDSNGNTQTWTVTYTTIAVANQCGTNTHCFDPTASLTVPQTLQLPTGRTYNFKWNSNSMGELQEIDLPTGGSISYTYTYGCSTNPDTTQQIQDCRMRVKTRTVTQNGTSGTWTYQLWPNLPSGFGTVTDPYGNDEVHTFTDLGSGGNSTYETQVQYWNGSSASGAGGTVLKTVVNKYASDGGAQSLAPMVGSTPINVRRIEQDITLEDGSERATQWDYQDTSSVWWGTATRMNVTAQRDYDYGAGGIGPMLRQTKYTYLHTGNQSYINANIVDRVLTTTVYDGVGNQMAQTTNEYDNYSHSGQTMVSSGAVQHDANFSTSYTLRGNVTAVKHWRNTDGALLTTTNQYDDAGNLISVIDPLGHKTTYDFTDSWSNATCAPVGQGKAYIKTVTNAAGQTTTNTYNSCTGSKASTTDPNSQVTSFTFDLLGRLTRTTFPDTGQSSTCYSDTSGSSCYSASTPLSTTHTDKITTSGINRIQVSVYDDLGRLEETKLTSDPDGTTYTRTSYDLMGRKSQEWNPTRCDPFANPSSCSGESTFGLTTYNYDALGRTVKVIPPDGTSSSNFESTSYSGRTSTVTDQAGHSRKSQSDGLGRLTSVWEDPAGLNYQAIYQYDALGDMLCVEQHGGVTGTGCSSPPSSDSTSPWRVRRFTYNSLSELLTAKNPESGTITYAYDNDGELISKLDARGITATYSYDNLHRNYQKSYSDGTPTAKYGFDGVAGLASCPPSISVTNAVGRRTAMCDGSGKTSWSYDPTGRELIEQKAIGTITEAVNHTYNLDGSIATETFPSGRMITYTPSAAGRDLSAIDVANNLSYATSATYAPQGALSSYASTKGTSILNVATTYNSRLQPLQLYFSTNSISSQTLTQMQGNTCPSTMATIMSRVYNFGLGVNDNGNIQTITNCRDGNRTQNFLYDSLNRIQQAYTNGPNWGETFGPAATNPGVPPSIAGIDAWGNLANRSPVNGKTNYELLSVAVTNQNQLSGFGYDANGNMTQNGSAQYSYDAENRLIAAGSMSYIYDGDGERVEKCTEGGSAGSCATNPTGTLYWGSGPLAETDLSGNLISEYVYFDGKRIARRDASGDVFRYVSDHLGSASVIVYGTGSIKSESDYYPYGGEIPISGGDTNHYKFTGKERDSESGLDNFGARYDSSSLGRFMTPDWAAKPTAVPYAVFGDPQTLNLYSYVENAPVNRADADGHCGGNTTGSKCPTPKNDQNGNSVNPQTSSNSGEQTHSDKVAAAQASTLPVALPPLVLPPVGDALKGLLGTIVDGASTLVESIAVPLVMTNHTATNKDDLAIPPSTSQQGTINTGPINSGNTPRSTLPRAPNGDYLPHPGAQGPHTTLGTRTGHDGVPYTQGATFDAAGRFVGRTDVTSHPSIRKPHPDPHFHPATSPNSVGPAQAIPQN